MNTIPSKDIIRGKLELLLSGHMSREETSEWACQFYLDENIEIDDGSAWKLLGTLVLADAMTSEGYLYHDVDFRAWLKGSQC